MVRVSAVFKHPKKILEMNKISKEIANVTYKLNIISRKHSTIIRSPTNKEKASTIDLNPNIH
jgi:hypothetical protein